MEQSGVDRAVLIQHQGTTDNSYHVECLQAHPDRLASAMIVESTDDGEQMRYWADQGLVGIRLFQSPLRRGSLSTCTVGRAARLNHVVSIPSSPSTLLFL